MSGSLDWRDAKYEETYGQELLGLERIAGSEVDIRREAEKERLTLAAGQARFALQTLGPEDFPDLTAGELGHSFAIPAKELKRLIDKTRFAISTEETRYYLNGIFFHIADGPEGAKLRAVATDGPTLRDGSKKRR